MPRPFRRVPQTTVPSLDFRFSDGGEEDGDKRAMMETTTRSSMRVNRGVAMVTSEHVYVHD